MISQERMNVINKEALCINCGCCVSECNAMESDPDFLGPQALAKAMRFVGDPRDAGKVDRLENLNGKNGIWQCTRCYFCNERCPKGVDPRDAIAKLGAESVKEGVDRDMGAKHAKWFVTLGEDDRLAARDRARPEDPGDRRVDQAGAIRLELARVGKVPPPFPPHVAKDVKESRRLHELVARSRIGRATAASSRERRRSRSSLTAITRASATRTARARSRGRTSPGEDGDAGVKKVAYYKGCLASLSAKELDSSTQALAPKVGLELEELESVTCCGAGDIHEAEPDYYLHLNARILAYAAATGADTLLTVCNVCTLNLRQANWQLIGDAELRARVNENLVVGRRARVRARRRRPPSALGARGGRGLRAAEGGGAQGSEGAEDRAVLRLPDPASLARARLRGSRPARRRSSGSSRPAAARRSTTPRSSSAAASRSSRHARRRRSAS